jgi:hypothetical protein
MKDIGLYFRDLDHLMGVVGPEIIEIRPSAPRTGLRFEVPCLGRIEKGLPAPEQTSILCASVRARGPSRRGRRRVLIFAGERYSPAFFVFLKERNMV